MNKECKSKCPSDCELGTWFVKNEEETDWIPSPTTVVTCGKYPGEIILSPFNVFIEKQLHF